MDRKMAELILDKKLEQLSQRLNSRKVSLTISDEAKEYLLEKGYSSQYGAREMDRAIQQYLTPILMQDILFGKLAKGGIANIILNTDGLEIDR